MQDCGKCKLAFTESSIIKLFESVPYHDSCLELYKKEVISKYPHKCPECKGKGTYYHPFTDMFGAEVWGEDRPCEFCNGAGRLAKEPKKIPTAWKYERG